MPDHDALPSLVCHSQVKMVAPSEAAEIIRGRAKMEIVGVLGIATQAMASYLVICTSRQHAATMPQGEVYRATDIDLREVGRSQTDLFPHAAAMLSSAKTYFTVFWCACLVTLAGCSAHHLRTRVLTFWY